MKKHNKFIAGVMAVCLAFGMGVIPQSFTPVLAMEETTAASYDEIPYTPYDPYENLSYKKYSDHVEITKCSYYKFNTVIPAEIDGLPVTSIGREAFSYCTGLKSIKIPDSVTSIGSNAFEHCESLTSIEIPDSVTSIEGSAFSYCNFTSLKITEILTSIGEVAFEH